MNDYTSNTKEVDRRQCVIYSEAEKKNIRIRKKITLLQIELIETNGISNIYDNQEECSMEIVAKFHNKNIINIMVVAQTQSGKTGTMLGLIKNYLGWGDILIPIENIYIITGLSSCEWKEQTKERMPGGMWDRVYHRDNLTTKFVKDIKDKKNVLVIMDEIQIAARKNQTLFKTFKRVGFYNKQYLLRNDIKIIEFSATPDGIIYDQKKWGQHSYMQIMRSGDNYTGCVDLYKNGRVKQFKDLYCLNKITNNVNKKLIEENFKDIQEDIKKYNKTERNLYHIIRTPNASKGNQVIKNFKYIFGENIKIYNYDQEGQIKDINDLLKKTPREHTFIFIKEKLRCAKTLYKKYLGIIYERFVKKPDDAVMIQGLIGRNTGYDDNGISIVYTNIGSIEKYKKLWESEFKDTSIKWKSKTTQIKHKILMSKDTMMSPKLITGMSKSDDDDSYLKKELTINKFKTQDEVKKYYNENLKIHFGGRGPNKRKPNGKGFYETTIGRETKVHSTTRVFETKIWALNETHHYTFHPCYRNVEDKSTLEFWIIHY